ncbi:MAG: hypothetical protein PUD09_01325 [Coriobacteriales bacterium]|nr:hypothetical protein [Coriobacteriales bacterium]
MTRDEWLTQLCAKLLDQGISKKDVQEAQEFYAEALDDRMEDGMTEAEAVADLGDVRDACDSVVESLPPVRRAVAGVRQSRERTVLVIVLLILGAVAWVPLAAGLALLAVAVYAAIWCVIAALWAVDITLLLMGGVGIAALVEGLTTGVTLTGVYSCGVGLVLCGAGIALMPVMAMCSVQLARLTGKYARWLKHFFVRVAKGDQADAGYRPASVGSWWQRNASFWRPCLLVALIVATVGGVLVLIGLIACGFDPQTLPMLPELHAWGASVGLDLAHWVAYIS